MVLDRAVALARPKGGTEVPRGAAEDSLPPAAISFQFGDAKPRTRFGSTCISIYFHYFRFNYNINLS